MSQLYQIIEWAKQEGEVKIIDRMRVYVLGASVREGIQLARITKETQSSPEYVALVRKVASDLVGKPCPY